MRLFSYCIPTDDGAAPNPYWGVCTLAICKPVIRRVAEEGDWIVGVGSKNVNGKDYSGKLVYAMRVSNKMTLREYDIHCQMVLKEKIPDVINNDYRRQVGDCIYEYENKGYEHRLRDSVHGPKNVDKDLRGVNVLMADQFYYFGNKAVELPPQFLILARQNQGHQSTRNQFIKSDFVQWLQKTYEANKLYGEPQVKVNFAKDKNGNYCATRRCESADEDEAADYSEEKLPTHHWNYFRALEADLKTTSRYIEIHPDNFSTFSTGLAQLFLAASSEIDVVLKQLCDLLSGEQVGNMKEYSRIVAEKLPSLQDKRVFIPIYGIELQPFKDWTASKKFSWWDAYNEVKHHRNTHYEKANLGNALNALGGLYILIFELIRVHKGKSEGGFGQHFVYRDLQPQQELFRLEREEYDRDILENPRRIYKRGI
ncbi:MAG: hypothetical protein JNJ75_05860 [Cyclobacteriaceae bacterium]|nr:hypothetical protein [Cyclobacteriaceae bacterium]